MNWYKIAEAENALNKNPSSLAQKPKVLMVSLPGIWNISDKDLMPLKEVAEVEWIQTKEITEKELGKKCDGYDYLMLNMDPMPFPDPNKIEKLTKVFYSYPGVQKLKGINVDMTDVDFFNPMIARKYGIVMQDCPNTTTESVAESALTEILLHARERNLAYSDVASKEDMQCRKMIDLKGKIAGIIGKGNIGSRVGSFLENMGMKVMYYDIDGKKSAKDSLERMFKESSVISIHIPCHQPHTNKSNEGFIGQKLLSICNDLILINLATDIIVDISSLKDALKSGRVRGYSVEKGRQETEGLKKYPNVHISPCSFNSNESVNNIKRVWIDNMISAVQGSPKNIWK